MNLETLARLHFVFQTALQSSKYIYIGEDADQNQCKQTTNKEIRLHTVFERARDQIAIANKDFSSQKVSMLKARVAILVLLQEDGQSYYKRYEAATSTFSRKLFKELARLTPNFLKSYLPACFSNQMEDAEWRTKHKYETYISFIQASIKDLTHEIEKKEEAEKQPSNQETLQSKPDSSAVDVEAELDDDQFEVLDLSEEFDISEVFDISDPLEPTDPSIIEDDDSDEEHLEAAIVGK